MELNEIIKEVFAKERKNKFTFLTGAGISADSGIPTYRGNDGIWVKGTEFHKPEEFGTYKYFSEHQEEVWQYVLFRKKMIEHAQPNESHKILAQLEKLLGDRVHIITQNIDNLHKRAGNTNLFEIHGNYREVKCSKECVEILPMPLTVKGKNIDEDLTSNEIDILKCSSCGNWLRPNVLWFDEYYDEKTNKKVSSLKIAKSSGVLFVVGTSGATNLPVDIVKNTIIQGGYVIDLNIEDNYFSERFGKNKRFLSIRARSSEILPQIKEAIEKCLENNI